MSASKSPTKFRFWQKPIILRTILYSILFLGISDIKQNAFIYDENSWELFDKLLLFKILNLAMLVCHL